MKNENSGCLLFGIVAVCAVIAGMLILKNTLQFIGELYRSSPAGFLVGVIVIGLVAFLILKEKWDNA